MTRLQRIREEQEKLSHGSRLLGTREWKRMHKEWLTLQREALAILRGEKCEEHGFEDCPISPCKPPGPLRPERG